MVESVSTIQSDLLSSIIHESLVNDLKLLFRNMVPKPQAGLGIEPSTTTINSTVLKALFDKQEIV